MQKLQHTILALTFASLTSMGFGACHAVGPSAAGNGSGSDWANRMNRLPNTLVRGDTYYLSDGNYANYKFTTPNHGTTIITIKKAQGYDFGRASDGCFNDISLGWNVTTMGSSQAIWNEFYGGTNTPQPGYLTLDGNGTSTVNGCGTSPTTNTVVSDCGLKVNINVVGQDSGFDIGANNNDGKHRSPSWTLRYFEIQGGGDANNGAQSEEEIRCRGACDDLLVDHSWLHDSGCDFFKIPWTTAMTVQNSYIKQNISSATCHGQLWYSEVQASNVNFHNNVIQDIQGTGMWVTLTGGQSSNFNIYNNVIFRTQGSSRPGFSNGLFSCINPGNQCTNINFIGNSVANYTADYSGALGIHCDGNPNTFTWKNNVFYNTVPNDRIAFQVCGGVFTEDHNSWLNSGSPINGSGDITVTSGAPNPFLDWPNANFTLVSQNLDWMNGTTLSTPFNVDAIGNSRPGSDGVWDRGAYQFTGATQKPAPPTSLRSVVH